MAVAGNDGDKPDEVEEGTPSSSFALNLPAMVVKVKDTEPPACLT